MMIYVREGNRRMYQPDNGHEKDGLEQLAQDVQDAINGMAFWSDRPEDLAPGLRPSTEPGHTDVLVVDIG